MLPRILLKNEIWLMTIDWLGLGKLEVSHHPTGRNAAAPPWLKSHFINTMHALSSKGVPIGPGNSIALQAMETYAEFILNPQGLMARAALSQSPEQMADAMLEENISEAYEPESLSQKLQQFINGAQVCAQEFYGNAEYIESELKNVEMTENLRQMTIRICNALKTTRDEVFGEFQSWKSKSLSREELTQRINKVVGLLSKNLNELHVLVMSIRAQADIDKKFDSACILVEESATNIYKEYTCVDNLAKELRGVS